MTTRTMTSTTLPFLLSGWVSSEYRPPHNRPVIVLVDGLYGIGCYKDGHGDRTDEGHWCLPFDGVFTLWCEIPLLPEGTKVRR